MWAAMKSARAATLAKCFLFFFIFGRHGDAVFLFDGQTEFERINRVQTETVDKQGGVGFDVFGLDVFKAKRGDDQGLEFDLQFFFRHLYWGGASRFIGPVQRVGF